ncbi:GNAT family acetyltransferase [Paenibacillus glucanolyticus]|uniref:GNAT family acetyltransferase n=1 Tax=Paenibacillus glucanolyticus TaxID=59843 RepID=A0A163KJW2_9BACL|nr:MULTISPECIES: GNAT family N-acetyltransferase [Paenibacillus]AWP29287.1 N-acetyltransferase [Paenibacillus sp. Cedars]KZS47289.1 GNAT family acetyltransferase [Paenibacillus glucanolyticus]MDH6672519.1 GNAT superfamily N-acetyltransferase [Paenibacillus sp. LBL]MPY19921.1 GNAT family N-acetyltransferase [Paenibacillus glucanolyticus]
MGLYFTNETIEADSGDNNYVRNQMIEFNLNHFPDDLKGRYQEINLLLRNADGEILGGIVGEICWNWLEIHYLFVDERFRKSGYGAKLLSEVENMAREKQCEFVKLDTLSFQALDFYIKQGYEIYGKIENAGRHTHYYMKKDL